MIPRAPLLLLAAVAMLAGLDAALLLLGVWAPVTGDQLRDMHGILMVLGFVGTLISLERAIALRHPLGYLAPALLGAGSLLLLAPIPMLVGRIGLVLGTLALCVVYLPLWRRQRDDAVLVQILGAFLGFCAALMWLGGVQIASLIPWLTSFLVLTIAGERLELARLAMGPSAGPKLLLLTTLLIAATVASLLWPAVGHHLLGLAMLLLTGWLLRHDAARRTVHSRGLTRFMAANMLIGYFWLLVTGVTWLLRGAALGGARYDIVVHATFLGFTITMIMAHAPIILPAVLHRPLPYRAVLWVPVVLMHTSLVLRLWLGDLLDNATAWRLGGVLNVVSLLLFFALAAWSVLTKTPQQNRRAGSRSVA